MEEDHDDDNIRRGRDLARLRDAPPGTYGPDPEGVIPDAIAEFYRDEGLNAGMIEDLEALRTDLNSFMRKGREARLHFGYRLMSVKAGLTHGQFAGWLARAFPLHHRTANNWMGEARKHQHSKLELSSNFAYKLQSDKLETKEQTRRKKMFAEQAMAGKLLLLLSKRLNEAEMNHFFGYLEQTSIKEILGARPHIHRLESIPEVGPILEYLRRPEDGPPAAGDPRPSPAPMAPR